MFSLTDITGRKASNERVETIGWAGQVRTTTVRTAALALGAAFPTLIILTPLLGIYSFLAFIGIWAGFFTILNFRTKDGFESNLLQAALARYKDNPGKIYLCGVEIKGGVKEGILRCF